MLADQLDLDTTAEGDVLEPWTRTKHDLERYLRRPVFSSVEEPIVWGLDVSTGCLAATSEAKCSDYSIPGTITRVLDPSGPWSRLTLAIAYATEAHLFIKDLNQSPFNVGNSASLDDFNLEQIAELNKAGTRAPLSLTSEIERFRSLVGGHCLTWSGEAWMR